jgi:hypothetical protein
MLPGRDKRCRTASLRIIPGARYALAALAVPYANTPGLLPQAELVGAVLEKLGVTPDVAVTTGGWLPLPFLIAGTDLVTAVPERLAHRVSGAVGVTVSEPPFGDIELVEAARWHPMRATDPALGWLRTIVREAAGC